jgi:hypothetical protein
VSISAFFLFSTDRLTSRFHSLAPGQPNNSADTTYDNATEGSKTNVHKGLGDDDKSKGEKDEDQTTLEGHMAEIKSATERIPESADSI